jgi:hypothetical protein
VGGSSARAAVVPVAVARARITAAIVAIGRRAAFAPAFVRAFCNGNSKGSIGLGGWVK